MGFLGFLGGPLGWVMDMLYRVVNNYGWAIILFTVLTRVVMLPLSIKQQKSTARMTAYQPMLDEVRKKYANDQQKQQEELMKLQQEYGFSMTAGCLPMIVSMLVLFGVIEVVYRPLQYILRVPKSVVTAAISALNITGGYTAESSLISMIQANPALGEGLFTAEQMAAINGFNFSFFGIDLSQLPRFEFSAAALPLLVFPVLSVLTMFLSNVIMTKTSGQEMQGAMKWMPWIMSLMFVTYSFQVPVAFSLYYTISNVVGVVQQVFLKKMYDPEKIKQQVQEEIEEKRRARKQKKQVTLVDKATGETVTREVSEAEMVRLRMARARALDEERYKDERTTPLAAPADGKE